MSKTYIRNLSLTMVSLLFSLLAPSNNVCAQVPCEYDVTIIQAPVDCGVLGTVITIGSGLNEHGAVVGYYKCPGATFFQGFVWTAEDGYELLEPPAGVVEVIPADINDNGVICGTLNVAALSNRGFVYDHGKWTILPPVENVADARSSVAAINNAGVVVGQRSLTSDPTPENAFIWSAEKGFMDLGVMSGGVSQATGITENGEVVGSTGGLASPGQEAFLWQKGKLTFLGYIPQGISSWAIATSSHGKIAGGGLMDPDKSELPSQPAFWENGNWELLGVLPGCDIGGSRDVNDLGMVAGSCTEPDNTKRAFVWDDGFMFDLNDLILEELGFAIQRGRAINNVGQIVALGKDEEGEIVAFLLAPQQKPLGDINGDCTVDIADLIELLENWGRCPDNEICDTDLDQNGMTNTADLLILFANWGGR